LLNQINVLGAGIGILRKWLN